MHNISIMIISFFHTGNVNNVRIGAKTQGRICKKIHFSLLWCTFCLIMIEKMPSVWDYWLSIALFFLMYATGLINPMVVKTRNESTVQTSRLTFSAFASLLGCGTGVIRQDTRCSFVRVRETAACWLHYSSPRPAQHLTEDLWGPFPTSPWFLQ